MSNVVYVSDDDISPDIRSLSLCSELEITGDAIYQGAERFYYTDELDYADVFYFLYQTSIGIERLMKIALKLLSTEEPNITLGSINSHNLSELNNKISLYTGSSMFNNVQLSFLGMLSDSYKVRYFNLDDAKELKVISPKNLLDSFIAKYSTDNESSKKLIGTMIGTISKFYYQLIRDASYKLNVYTYELSYSSNAYKVFYIDDEENVFNVFRDENRTLDEVVVSLLNLYKKNLSDTARYLMSIDPLESLYTEIDLIDTIRQLKQGSVTQDAIDLVNSEYEDMDTANAQKRGTLLDIFNQNVLENLTVDDVE